MNREEFFQKAVIEMSSRVTPVGAWKAQIDKAIEMADYLTTKLYGVNDTLKLRPVNVTVHTPTPTLPL